MKQIVETNIARAPASRTAPATCCSSKTSDAGSCKRTPTGSTKSNANSLSAEDQKHAASPRRPDDRFANLRQSASESTDRRSASGDRSHRNGSADARADATGPDELRYRGCLCRSLLDAGRDEMRVARGKRERHDPIVGSRVSAEASAAMMATGWFCTPSRSSGLTGTTSRTIERSNESFRASAGRCCNARRGSGCWSRAPRQRPLPRYLSWFLRHPSSSCAIPCAALGSNAAAPNS